MSGRLGRNAAESLGGPTFNRIRELLERAMAGEAVTSRCQGSLLQNPCATGFFASLRMTIVCHTTR
jgi:hypothetical protein